MASGILAFTNAQQGARDAKRRADLDAISKAMEQYFSSNSSNYPTANYSTALGPFFPSGKLPTDATGSAYTITSTSSTYCACAQLNKANGNASSLGSGGTCNYVVNGFGQYQCTSQRQ